VLFVFFFFFFFFGSVFFCFFFFWCVVLLFVFFFFGLFFSFFSVGCQQSFPGAPLSGPERSAPFMRTLFPLLLTPSFPLCVVVDILTWSLIFRFALNISPFSEPRSRPASCFPFFMFHKAPRRPPRPPFPSTVSSCFLLYGPFFPPLAYRASPYPHAPPNLLDPFTSPLLPLSSSPTTVSTTLPFLCCTCSPRADRSGGHGTFS